jgi:hypothetical protein
MTDYSEAFEGTGFQALLDALRRGLSLRYIESTDLVLAELALARVLEHASVHRRVQALDGQDASGALPCPAWIEPRATWIRAARDVDRAA